MKKLRSYLAIEGIDYTFRSELSPDNPQPVTRLKPLRTREAHNPITMFEVRGAGQLRDF